MYTNDKIHHLFIRQYIYKVDVGPSSLIANLITPLHLNPLPSFPYTTETRKPQFIPTSLSHSCIQATFPSSLPQGTSFPSSPSLPFPPSKPHQSHIPSLPSSQLYWSQISSLTTTPSHIPSLPPLPHQCTTISFFIQPSICRNPVKWC